MSGSDDIPATLDELFATAEKRVAEAQAGIKSRIEQIRSNTIASASFVAAVKREQLTLDNIHDLADALAHNTTLESLNLNKNYLGAEGLRILAPALAAHPSLREIQLNYNSLTDEAVQILVETFHAHPTLSELCAADNEDITPQGYAAFAPLLGNRVLCSLAFGVDNNQKKEPGNGFVALSEKALKVRSKNLVTLWPVRGDAVGFCKRNEEKAKALITELQETPLHALPIQTMQQAAIRLPALRHWANSKSTGKEAVTAFTEFLKTFDLAEVSSRESLTQANPDGLTPLDNPLFWEGLDQHAAELAAKGQSLTKAIVSHRNRDGDPSFFSGIRMEKTDAVLRAINAGGEYLTPEDLLEADGKPNAVLRMILEEDDAAKLFTEANWRAQGKEAMMKVYNALPPAAQESVNNLHGLLARCGSHAGRGR